MKIAIRISLVLAIILLGYMCVMSIVTPIRFDEKRAEREAVIIKNLMDIRKAEIEFKNQNNRYTASIDTLIDFVKNAKTPLVLKEGMLTDEQLKNGLTEAKAVKMVEKAKKTGRWKEVKDNNLENFRRDTTFVSVYESLFANDYKIENIGDMFVIPFSGGQKFEFAVSMYKNEVSGITIPLFEAKAHFNTYLADLDRQELVNLTDTREKQEKFPGLMVGSIDEPNNNAGNWE